MVTLSVTKHGNFCFVLNWWFSYEFKVGIGSKLSNGDRHELRAPDYDDWSTTTTDGRKGLNGDILVWNPMHGKTLELSSMGIRVDADTLKFQLKDTDTEDRENRYWHQRLIKGEYPKTIGGGIGQSRVFMLLLKKLIIGEVLPTVWSDEMVEKWKKQNINIM